MDVRAKQAAEKLGISGEIGGERPSGAKARVDFVGFMRGLKPPPPSESSFPAACKARTLHSDEFFRGRSHGGYISKKLRIIWRPPSVKTLSGWNCTTSMGRLRWRRPMMTEPPPFSGVRADR